MSWKLKNGYEVKHFKKEEFACPCCGQVHIEDEFIERLDKARYVANVPFIITSGYRCPKHNEEIGGVPDSAHVKGLAADIKCTDSSSRFKIVDAAIACGLKRIGIGADFIHLDYDLEKPRPIIWTYYKH